ncbi:nucleotide kinase [Mycobacterium phage Krypton555]|uniref:DUF3310 domain-containing protein n=1 Tax=Mycobacterium phage Krypton555 TaxID=2015885 RepID=A0A222ZS52_9CAUD|nr:nucleotide kinase [Mycobacterium phage Krypton555]ASR87132.1 hypothetical protein KRYPTON555_96 [Mycobacterium phage Krypton555]
MTTKDAINPSHYKDGWSNGAEVIDITENLNFNRGNAVKYIARAGAKDPDKTVEDLEKAQWYLQRELKRLKREADKPKGQVVDTTILINGGPVAGQLMNEDYYRSLAKMPRGFA